MLINSTSSMQDLVAYTNFASFHKGYKGFNNSKSSSGPSYGFWSQNSMEFP